VGAVNIVTIAVDLQAGAAGLGLLTGADPRWLLVPLGIALAGLLAAGRYHQVVAVLRCLLPVFLVFAVALILARPNWEHLLRGSVAPALSFGRVGLAAAMALLGTALTAYVYVWETVGRGVEEPPASAPRARRHITAGAVIGSTFTALVLWCMLAASAATLSRQHRPLTSAAAAAQALRPLAGSAAADLFAVGLVVSALVALPVLIATTAYMAAAQFGWRRGLSQSAGTAPAFYAVLGAALGLGLALSLAGVSW
jgi:Mn2+/Fe2+ NRAMP family transporter